MTDQTAPKTEARDLATTLKLLDPSQKPYSGATHHGRTAEIDQLLADIRIPHTPFAASRHASAGRK